MATIKQIAASRATAQKSTGPRTAEGKANSRYNALKHGIYAERQIMFDEKPEDLANLAAEYHEEHAPSNPAERMLVDTLVHNEWRLRRMRTVEAALWNHAADSFLAENPQAEESTFAQTFVTGSTALDRLQRIVNSCERNFHRALKALRAAQADAVRAPQPEQSKPTSELPASIRQNPEAPAIPTPEALQNPVPPPRPTVPTIEEFHNAAVEAISDGRDLSSFKW